VPQQTVVAPSPLTLRQVRAALLRTRATRHAIVQALLASVFLIGALAHALSPERHAQGSLVWMSALLVFSTFDVALGLRTLVRLRLRRRLSWVWIAGAAAWGLLSTALVGFLLRG
jgi:hypothetical protein